MSASMQKQTETNPELDQLCINTIRTLTLDAVQKAESGHPGLLLGAAPMAYVLWTRFLRHNPKNPKWENRDRFLLSAGHGSMLLYALLYLTGYDLPLDEIKNFRQWGSKGDVVCLDRFGASAPGDVALRNLGFNVDNVLKHAKSVL